LTWYVASDRPHVGLVSALRPVVQIVHNIGWGAQEIPLLTFLPFKAAGHYRWPG
jgi:uncharacterized protein YijF (DUF1287 family)